MVNEVLEILPSLKIVLMSLVFIGIVVWAFWPKRKKRLEALGRIPLDDDDVGSKR